jgi:hypothetical protein
MSEFPKLGEDVQKAEGWVKTHIAWLIGLGAFIVGALAGHLIR